MSQLRLFAGFLSIIAFLMACNPSHPSKSEALTELDSISYMVGVDIARYYAENEISLNLDMVYKGYMDVRDNDSSSMDEESLSGLKLALNEMIQRKQMQDAQRRAAENIIRGQKFLEKNKEKEGVVELASGLQYKIQKQGTGFPPTIDNQVRATFTGRLIDGTIFTSTFTEEDTTAIVDVGRALPGLTEALLMMKPGDRWEIFMPSELGMGTDSKSPVPPNSVLIFDLEMQEIVR